MTDALTDKQRVFVEEYLTCWNATEATRRAGYSGNDDTLRSIGSENLTKPNIRAFIDQRLKEKAMSADEVLARLADHARASLDDFVTQSGRGFRIDIAKAKKAGKLHLLKSVKKGKQGTSIELVDQQAALVHLGKRHHLFSGEVDENGSDNKRIITIPADLIAPQFLAPCRDIRDQKHSEYVFYGGRGSTKSSFESVATVMLLVNNPTMHALGLRQVADTLRDSVYAQISWAIDQLDAYYPGLASDFKRTTSPLEITYKPTGQKIYFRGADDPGKIKSIKPPFGYIGIAWFEELDQFHGPEAVRKIEQSAIRGGDIAFIFKSFNPPPTANNWANKYIKIPKPNQLLHFSSYLDVPVEWLGKAWLEEAAYLKEINLKAYEHEYLGIPSSAGGTVFENVSIRKITDEEIAEFDHVLHGLDWGYYPDPADYGRCHYDAARRKLYIFAEFRAWKQSNHDMYDGIKEHGYRDEDLLICDSAEPKSVADFREYGSSARGAEKGPDSVKYSIKWLQGLTEIIIDNERCPYAAEEFLDYEYEQDPDGNFISEYPDKNNHSIDRVRYATNLIWRRRGQ
jgi:PBSX family phage terminase large subunit